MPDIARQIHKILIRKEKTIAVAESCSAGLLSSLLTRFSGSSRYFMLGIVAYSNEAKKNVLKIPFCLIAKHGAVSGPVAVAMAEAVRKIAKADFGIGITGIAGPTGAMPHKPVGTVFIAVTAKNKTLSKKFHFSGNRQSIRKKSVLKALELLKNLLWVFKKGHLFG